MIEADKRKAIFLLHEEGMPLREIARRLHVSRNTVAAGFSEWGSFLKNAHLTAALIDRLTENSQVINMKQCVSLRPKLSPES